MTDRADKVAAKTVDACDHAAIPDVGEEGGACIACVATALRDPNKRRRWLIHGSFPGGLHGLNSPLHAIDSLATELEAVPPTRIATCISGCHTMDGGPDGPALAAAAREWVANHQPEVPDVGLPEYERGYRCALADMAKALGL